MIFTWIPPCFHIINFSVPEGYWMQGLDKFNFKVENETSGFISTTTKEGNKEVIKTRKFYKHNFEKAIGWGKMVTFLDAAYQLVYLTKTIAVKSAKVVRY